MTPRIHVPFDNWAMPVDVQVSQLVRVGDLAWSCGQCPLDAQGQVLMPGDLLAQVEIVCDYIEAMLPRADLGNEHIAQLVAYYVETNSSDVDGMTEIFRERFGEVPLIAPIAVPHFYYPGLMIEVDVSASAVTRRVKTKSGRAKEHSVHGGVMSWTASQFPSEIFNEESYFTHSGQEPFATMWVADPHFDPFKTWDKLRTCGLYSHDNTIVTSADRNADPLCLSVTIADHSTVRYQRHTKDGNGLTNVSRAGDFFWITGTHADGEVDLIGQTQAVMGALTKALDENGLSFNHVVKLNAHYVGSPSAEDLHENMEIRHSYYGTPGPASTGLPVAGLHHPDARIAIDIIAVA